MAAEKRVSLRSFIMVGPRSVKTFITRTNMPPRATQFNRWYCEYAFREIRKVEIASFAARPYETEWGVPTKCIDEMHRILMRPKSLFHCIHVGSSDLSVKQKGLFGSPRIMVPACLPYLPRRDSKRCPKKRRTAMIRMIRVSTFVIAAAIAASNLTSPASAQAFSNTWGTGNVEATHYDANGRLARDSVSQNPTIARDQGLSAFAASPRKIHHSRGY